MKATNVQECIAKLADAEAAENLARAAFAAAQESEAIARSAFDSTHADSDAEAFTKSVLLAGSACRAHATALAGVEAARASLSQAQAAEAAEREAAEIAGLIDASSIERYAHDVRGDLATIAASMSAMTKAFANVATARKASNDALKKLHARGKCQQIRPLDGCADTGIILRELMQTNVHFADVRGLRHALASDSSGTLAFPGAMVAFMARYLDALVYKCSPVQLTEERNAVAVYPESRDISEANARAATTSKVKAA